MLKILVKCKSVTKRGKYHVGLMRGMNDYRKYDVMDCVCVIMGLSVS